MDFNKAMPLLLLEDDVAECQKFKNCEKSRSDIRIVGMTGSSEEGLKLLKTHLPEGVILDLELHKGNGSGLQFLSEMKEQKLSFRPLVIITTNTFSNIVYDHVHSQGVDIVFYKKQPDYNVEMVVNTMISLRKSLYAVASSGVPSDLSSIESPECTRARIAERINSEFNQIGIGVHLKGRKYLFDAIFKLLNCEEGESIHVINQISNEQKIDASAISRAMQTAINNAWKNSSINDLEIHYKAKVDPNRGTPTPTEFIYYYADKIRNSL